MAPSTPHHATTAYLGSGAEVGKLAILRARRGVAGPSQRAYSPVAEEGASLSRQACRTPVVWLARGSPSARGFELAGLFLRIGAPRLWTCMPVPGAQPDIL